MPNVIPISISFVYLQKRRHIFLRRTFVNTVGAGLIDGKVFKIYDPLTIQPGSFFAQSKLHSQGSFSGMIAPVRTFFKFQFCFQIAHEVEVNVFIDSQVGILNAVVSIKSDKQFSFKQHIRFVTGNKTKLNQPRCLGFDGITNEKFVEGRSRIGDGTQQ